MFDDEEMHLAAPQLDSDSAPEASVIRSTRAFLDPDIGSLLDGDPLSPQSLKRPLNLLGMKSRSVVVTYSVPLAVVVSSEWSATCFQRICSPAFSGGAGLTHPILISRSVGGVVALRRIGDLTTSLEARDLLGRLIAAPGRGRWRPQGTTSGRFSTATAYRTPASD
jgi:hypothetical protein